MFAQGAWAVDVGGESTRPGAILVAIQEELDRIIPAVSALSADGVVSVDTRNPEVAEEAVRAGASLVNDVSGKLYELAGRMSVGYVGMHAETVPVNPNSCPQYADVYTEVARYLEPLARDALSVGA